MVVELAAWLEWVLNALIGLGALVVLSVLLFFVFRWRARIDKNLEEAATFATRNPKSNGSAVNLAGQAETSSTL